MLFARTVLESLPKLYEQGDDTDPIVYARIATPDNAWACYIVEGGEKDHQLEIFALFVSKRYGYNWAQLPLNEVEEDVRRAGLDARLDPDFTPARASKVVGITRHVQPATHEYRFA
jgi:hypothetical protein